MAKSPSPRGEASRLRREDDGYAPWLDEGEPERSGGTLIARSTLWIMLLGLLLLVSLVAAGVFMVARQDAADVDALPPGADIPLLRDPGPWKRAPDAAEAQGQDVAGVGNILYDTGDGRNVEAAIDLDRLPEQPVALDAPPAVPPAAPSQPPPKQLLPDHLPARPPGVAAPPPAPPVRAPERPQPEKAQPQATDTVRPRLADDRPVKAAVPVAPPAPAAATSGSSTIQLGAFSSEARARAAWKSLADRFGYLDGLSPAIVPVAQDGRTLYRLRTTAADPAQANDICRRLKVAGESCAPV